MKQFLTAKDIASSQIWYIDGLASVKEAIALMKQHDTDVLVIAKRDEKDANGIVVISDIVKGVIIPGKHPYEVSVYEIMSKPAISIPASLNAKYVPRFLVNCKVSVAPVEENGAYVGVIHMKEILFNGKYD
ncbi:MAG: CBS domain-containing protein [Saprospiraceae bacterium]